jgi:coenzyme F420-reducing hydrogenase delta subunit
MSEFEPRILGFLCRYCSYAAADRAGQAKRELPDGFLPVQVMCTGRLRPEQILGALRAGADGVLVLGCHPFDCHFRTGNLKALATVRLTARLLEAMGLEAGRARIEWISALEDEQLTRVIQRFSEEIKMLGPIARHPALERLYAG